MCKLRMDRVLPPLYLHSETNAKAQKPTAREHEKAKAL